MSDNNQAAHDRAENLRKIETHLRRIFQWFDNSVPPDGIPVVDAQIGLFGFVGLRMSEEAGVFGDITVTTPKPHSLYLWAVSGVPTSIQTIHVLNDYVHALAKMLGAPADGSYVAMVQDPTRNDTTKRELFGHQDQHQMGQRGLARMDEYRNITRPYSITLTWPVPK